MLIPFNELFKRHNIKSKQVLHIGASSGQEAQAYANEGITSVIWVEALQSVHERLKANITRFPGHRALLACVSDVDGDQVIFHIANNEEQSSSMLEFGTHAKEHPTVKWIGHVPMRTRRMDTLLKHHNITLENGGFLNIDLQGAELKALKGMGSLLSHFDHAYIEVNEKHLYQNCPLVAEIDQYLYAFGFVGKETRMTNFGWGDKYYQRSVPVSLARMMDVI